MAPALLATLLALAALASSSELVGRFRFWKDGAWYRAVITASGGPQGRLPPALAPGSTAFETLEVRNEGALAWPRIAPSPVALSYHWLDAETGAMVVRDGLRTTLAGDVDPGGSAQVRAQVRAPSRPGHYVLWWDLVQEHTTWFSERGDPGLRQPILVGSGGFAGSETRSQEATAVWSGTPDEGARGTLWRAAVSAWRAHPLLGIGPDNFRHLSGTFLGRDHVDERMHANSLYFETLADLGLVGLVALLAVIVALAGAARRAIAAPASRILALGVAAGFATYLVHGLLDYFLEFTPTYALFWLLAGMLVAMESSPESAT